MPLLLGRDPPQAGGPGDAGYRPADHAGSAHGGDRAFLNRQSGAALDLQRGAGRAGLPHWIAAGTLAHWPIRAPPPFSPRSICSRPMGPRRRCRYKTEWRLPGARPPSPLVGGPGTPHPGDRRGMEHGEHQPVGDMAVQAKDRPGGVVEKGRAGPRAGRRGGASDMRWRRSHRSRHRGKIFQKAATMAKMIYDLWPASLSCAELGSGGASEHPVHHV